MLRSSYLILKISAISYFDILYNILVQYDEYLKLCVQTPFKIESNAFVQRLISKLEVPCPECGANIPRGDLPNHKQKFCLTQKGTDSPNMTSPPLTTSESMATGEQRVENAAGGETESSQVELTSIAKTHDWKSQSEKLRDSIAKLKCAQINEFDVLLEINIYIDACLPLEPDDLKSQVPPVEMFEFLSESINALKDAFAQLRSSQDSDSISKEKDFASTESATFDLSVDTSKAQCQRAEETLSFLQYQLRRLLTTSKTDEEVSVDNDIAESGISDVVTMTRMLFKELAELAYGSKAECNRSTVIADMTGRLDEYQQHFARAVIAHTREFKSVLAALECKRSYSLHDIVETPTKELIQQELVSLSDIQRALLNLNVLLIRTSRKDSSPLTTSLTGFESATGMHEHCQRAITTTAMLIFQLNSTVSHEFPQLRSVLGGETNITGLGKCVLQMVLELRDKFRKIACHVSKICTIEQLLNEMANAILDCYNSICDEVVKCVGAVMVQREHQNSNLNKRLDEVQSQLLDAQLEITRKENLVKEGESRVAEITQQFDGFNNQLLERQKEISRLENLVQKRDSKIAEIQQQLDEVRNQISAGIQQSIFQKHLVQEQNSKIAELQQQLNVVQSQLLNVQEQKTFQQHLAQNRDAKIDKVQWDNGYTNENANEEQDALNWKKANELAFRAACELKLRNGDSAAGTLYETVSRRTHRHLFISANRRLQFNSPDDLCNSQLLVFDVQNEVMCQSIALSRDKVLRVWNTRAHAAHAGNTVFELSDDATSECQSRGANFLRVGEARVGEEVRLKPVL